MTHYDFKILQPSEFECLSRDLIQARDGIYIESFTEGRDSGIDYRYAISKDKTAIIQVKRYATYSSLLSELKKEERKIKKLKPQRYYISTSVGLTPNNKTEIQNLFGRDVLSTSDILGKDDLNNLLGLYPDVEKRYYKLWLSSTTVLESILNKRIENWATFEMDKIQNDIHQYVFNDSFNEAMRILKEHRYVIISGIPGIGKTTLARMLVYDLLAHGMDDFIYIPSDIDDAVTVFDENRKQVFFFDDFLGSTVFEKGERRFDQKILNFIDKVKHCKDKLFILTTREYILSDAFLFYEKFQLNHIDIAKCTLALSYYTKEIKARILYNHLADAQLPDEYIDVLIENGNYKRLINHTNFNPRVIETFINDKVWESVDAKDFMTKLLNFFDSPLSVWEKAFCKLENITRYILLTLATMPLPVRVDDWKTAFEYFRNKRIAELGLYCDEQRWLDSIKVLEDCFIKTDRVNSTLIVQLFNPSVRDFLSSYIASHHEICKWLLDGAYYIEQLYIMFSDLRWYSRRSFFGDTRVIIGENEWENVKKVFLRLHDTKNTCTLRRAGKLTNQIDPYDEFDFLLKVLTYFPQLCRNNPGLIEQFVTEEMLEDGQYDISDRLKLLRNIKTECNSRIQPKTVLEKMNGDLELVEDYLEYIEAADDFEMKESLNTDEFRDRFMEDISREIDQAESDTDIESLEENIEKIGMKFPDWSIDFSEELDMQKIKLSERYYEQEEWEREQGVTAPMDEDAMIAEMFTSLRVKTE